MEGNQYTYNTPINTPIVLVSKLLSGAKELQITESTDQNWPCSQSLRDTILSLPCQSEITRQTWVSVSSCMWKRADKALFWVYYTAL